MAHGYYNKKDFYNFNACATGTAGSMVMNAHDLLIWANAVLTPGKVLSQHSLNKMHQMIPITEPVSHPIPVGMRFGLGMMAMDFPKLGTVWNFSGVLHGYMSTFAVVPTLNKTFVVQLATWPEAHEELLIVNQPFMQELFAFGEKNVKHKAKICTSF